MPDLDLNLLVALDALLDEGSVTGAAERLHTSAPAMSRTLGRLRRVLGDPILVRAGRGLVPTPRAVELRAEVRALVSRGQALLVPHTATEPAQLNRRFTLQTGDVLLTAIGSTLVETVRAQAPAVTLRFLGEHLEGTTAMRDGVVDLEVGVIDHLDPETRTEPLTTTGLVGVARTGHPLTVGPPPTAREFANADHLAVSRHGRGPGPVDQRLADVGLSRRVVTIVPSFTAALFLLRETELVGLAPARLGGAAATALGLTTFPLPVELPEVVLSMAWHPRNDQDAGHRWLRELVRGVVTSQAGPSTAPNGSTTLPAATRPHAAGSATVAARATTPRETPHSPALSGR
ncbi:LysR family transcriptional regulator [Kitasatospora sp. NPDC058406]|uniref:LysR family transcriptional regulator n=1 Tax=Kitasatospora sp. NPDC058406 TaxID=3346483 RepID=UPI00365E7FD9